MANPISFLFGYRIIKAELGAAADIFNAAHEYGIVYRNRRSEADTVAIECSLPAARRLKKICDARGIPLLSDTEHGVPHLLGKYRRRYGIFIGCVLCVALVILSGTAVWDVRIDGEKRLSEKQIIEELDACGLSIGTKTRSLDTDVIQTRMLIYSDDISWISINLIGTVAHVEIRESEPLPLEEPQLAAANLVASEDGEIVGFEDIRGDVAVRIGDIVNQGELLVSGIRDIELQGFVYKVASGKVYAKTKSVYSVDIPLKYEKKTYTDEVFEEKYLIFFNKEIKIYSNNRKNNISCDIIDTVEYANVLSMGKLPFGIRTVKYLPYGYESAERSKDEAIDLALFKLRSLEEELGVSDVISKQLSGIFSDGAYRLECTAVSVKNIAVQKEIEIAQCGYLQKNKKTRG